MSTVCNVLKRLSSRRSRCRLSVSLLASASVAIGLSGCAIGSTAATTTVVRVETTTATVVTTANPETVTQTVTTTSAPPPAQGFLGVITITLTPAYRQQAESEFIALPAVGVAVSSIVSGDSFDLADIPVIGTEPSIAGLPYTGLVIQAVNGHLVRSSQQLTDIISGIAPGTTVQLRVWRSIDAESSTMNSQGQIVPYGAIPQVAVYTVRLGARPPQAGPITTSSGETAAPTSTSTAVTLESTSSLVPSPIELGTEFDLPRLARCFQRRRG